MEFNTKDWPGKKSIAGVLSLPPKDCVRATTSVWPMVYPWEMWWPSWYVPSLKTYLAASGQAHGDTRLWAVWGTQRIDSQDTPFGHATLNPLPVWGTSFLFFSRFLQRLYFSPFFLVYSVYRKVRTRVLYTIWSRITQPPTPSLLDTKCNKGRNLGLGLKYYLTYSSVQSISVEKMKERMKSAGSLA